jgi:predicted enzyme related to lactoylglutathione lyase
MPTIGSLMLGTTDVERLHAWYAAVLPPDSDDQMDQYRILGYDGFFLFLDPRDDVADTNVEPGRFLLNVDTDVRAVEKRANEIGARWIAEVEDRDGSLFATLADPDGNAVQVVQLSEDARKQLEEGAGR